MGQELMLFDRQMAATVCGVDEAGRGPLAGPVYAACVCLRDGVEIPFLNDSKKMTEARREAAFDDIIAGSWYGIGFASPEEIDNVNILQATYLAMNRACTAMLETMDTKPQIALVDGNRDPGLPLPTRLIVKGDAKSAAIAAASVLAKVSRDRVMLELDKAYPQYGFGGHKGYPTAAHYAAIAEHGASPVHRRSFLSKLEKKDNDRDAARKIGAFGETYAEHQLVRRGYKILTRNWKCPEGEIDIIAAKDGILAFVEVKTRERGSIQAPAEAVDKAKQARILAAAQQYLLETGSDLQPRFDVAAISTTVRGGLLGVEKFEYIENAFVGN